MAWQDTRWRGSQTPGPTGPVVDMTPDGRFKARIVASGPGAQILGVAVLIAVLAGAGAIALLALWLAATLIPIAIGAALIAYGVFRFKVWQARNSLGRQRDVFRP